MPLSRERLARAPSDALGGAASLGGAAVALFFLALEA